ncbi:MAG: insulinase family protein [Planctomycetaceae bacterium]|nr:insulinase family protein [Planctomycetaceae bacterium]
MRFSSLLRFEALLAIALAACSASLAAAEPKKIATVEGITEYQCDNGFKVLLFPDPSRPTVTVNMTVLVGSRHEGYGEAGMAHLLEHMVFKGTPTHGNIPKALRDRGASFNGTTNADRTNYFETLPATDDNLEFAIRFETDRLVNSFVRREDLISEMTVVRNEFERGENSPGNLLGKRMMSAAYEWHNYGKTTIGNRSDIERVPIDNLQDFYRRYYQPDNAVLIVAGKFDEAKALKYVEQYCGSIPRPTRKLNTTYTEEPPQDGERKVELRRVGDVGLVEAVYHIPAASHEDFAPLEVLESILSTPPSGRFYKALVEAKKASGASAGAYAQHDPSVFDITLSVRKENSLDEARDIMLAALDELIAKGVTEEEVERAKRSFSNSRRQAALNTSSLAIGLSSWVAMGDWLLYFLHRDRVEAVKPADVQRVAARYLVPSNRTIGYFIPSDAPDLVTVPANPDLKAIVAEYKGRPPVATVEEFDYSFANVESRTTRTRLPSGIKVALLPKPTRDEEVNLSLTLRYGNAESLRELREAASMLSGLMLRGTKSLSYQQLRDEMSRLDVQIGSGGGGGRGGRGGRGGGGGSAGSVSFSVRARRSTLPAALDLLRQVLREPALDGRELETTRPQRIAGLEQARTDPQSLASDLLSRTLSPYPTDDIRYNTTPDEQIARLSGVTIDQVRKVYGEFLGATDGELVIVGDFDPAATLAKVNELLAGWKSDQPYARIAPQTFLDVPGGKQSILTPDKANAVYTAGLTIAMDDQHPDYPALVLGNYIFGGSSLASRLGDRVRQKEGLSYGVSSGFSAGSEDKLARLSIGAICNPANIGKVETAVMEELELIVNSGVTADELAKAKQGYLQSRELSRSSDSVIMGRLERSLRLDQTLAYDAEFEKRIAALTPDDVLAALKKHIDPKRLVVVIAGDFGKSE